jgi:hypothetical protein
MNPAPYRSRDPRGGWDHGRRRCGNRQRRKLELGYDHELRVDDHAEHRHDDNADNAVARQQRQQQLSEHVGRTVHELGHSTFTDAARACATRATSRRPSTRRESCTPRHSHTTRAGACGSLRRARQRTVPTASISSGGQAPGR